MGALYNLRTSEDMSSDHKRFTLKSKDANGEPTTVDLDTTAQYPIRQMSWVVEYLRNLPPESLGGIAGAAEYAFGDETGNTGTVSSWQEKC